MEKSLKHCKTQVKQAFLSLKNSLKNSCFLASKTALFGSQNTLKTTLFCLLPDTGRTRKMLWAQMASSFQTDPQISRLEFFETDFQTVWGFKKAENVNKNNVFETVFEFQKSDSQNQFQNKCFVSFKK